MELAGFCIITDDVRRLSLFYQRILRAEAAGDDVHTEIRTRGAGLAIYSTDAARKDMGFDFSTYCGSGKAVLMFKVDDVDGEYERLQGIVEEFMTTPKTYPWGARAFHFRDPDGNIVDLFSPPA